VLYIETITAVLQFNIILGVNERGKACMMAMDVGRSLAKEAGGKSKGHPNFTGYEELC
jgi:hypothetical protein